MPRRSPLSSSPSLSHLAQQRTSTLVGAKTSLTIAQVAAKKADDQLRSAEASNAAARAVSTQLRDLARTADKRATLSAAALMQYARASAGLPSPTSLEALFDNKGDLLGAMGAVHQLQRISHDPQALAVQANTDAKRATTLHAQADKAENQASDDAVESAKRAVASASEAVGTATAALEKVQLQATSVAGLDATSIGAPDSGQLSDVGWANPVAGHITDGFGPRPSQPAGAGPFHYGDDIAAACSTWIVAAASGTVVETGWYGSLGNWIVIDHGQGVQTAYAHLADGGTAVQVGEHVDAGEPIGLVGSTGASTGCHLHVEVHINGVRADPLPFFAARGIALGQ